MVTSTGENLRKKNRRYDPFYVIDDDNKVLYVGEDSWLPMSCFKWWYVFDPDLGFNFWI